MKFSDLNLLDFGHGIQLAGAIYASGTETYFMPFPDEGDLFDDAKPRPLPKWSFVDMSHENWKALLRQTDLLEVQATDGSAAKAIIRKSTRQIEQGVSWNVYRRDGYACRYCGADKIPLTVDHLVTWESGGPSIEANLVAACRKCNKIRAELPYAEWMRHPHYLKVAERLSATQRAANDALVSTLDAIPRRANLLRGR